MNSIRISIQANDATQDVLISELSELGAEGFEQKDDYLMAYFPELNFNSYEVNEALKGYNYHSSIVEEQNWNEVWEKNFQPVIMEDFCVIRADFHKAIPGIPYEIIITPKMSFGTGHHATTYMMMAQMKDLDFTGRSVFDFGTGTGILAILAEKLGAGNVYAMDNDEWSIDNAAENIDRNGCTVIRLELSATIPTRPFDIIIANINRNVILDNITAMYNCLNEKGFVLLSGLLVEDEKDIINICSRLNLHLVKRSEQNNWISLLFNK